MPGVVSNPSTDDAGKSTEASQAEAGGKKVGKQAFFCLIFLRQAFLPDYHDHDISYIWRRKHIISHHL